MNEKDRIKELEEELAKYKESPYLNAYTGLYATMERWSHELKTKTFSISAVEDDDMKAFEKAHKVSISMKALFDQLDFLRSKITPAQQEEGMKEATSIFEKALQGEGSLDDNS